MHDLYRQLDYASALGHAITKPKQTTERVYVHWPSLIALECHGPCRQTIAKEDLAKDGKGAYKKYCKPCYAALERERYAKRNGRSK
jgi:hypothetical protein